MGAPVACITASDADGREFTVRVERNFRYEPYRDFLACAHCDWRAEAPFSLRRSLQDVAGGHLAREHGADRRLGNAENPVFTRLRWIVLPVVAVFLIALFTMVR